MANAMKVEIVKSIQERIEGSKSILLIDYKGINIEEVEELRNRMRKENIDYFVSKNTLTKIALNNLDITALDNYLKGPTAIAVSKNDEVAPAKVISDFKKDVMEDKPFPSFKAGYVDNAFYEVDQLKQLAKLPSRDELIAKAVYCMKSPITGTVGVLGNIIKKFVYAINAIKEKKEN